MSSGPRTATRAFEYRDPEEGFRGFLAYAGEHCPLAAGGLRLQPGLTAARIESLAGAMQLKERVLALNVDGAKCGIDFHPAAPGRREALRRFLRFLEPHLRERLSLGPDMGTTFTEIEELARQEGIPSVKGAIARAQGLTEDEVLHRLGLLEHRVGALSLGERRAGHALAAATLAALEHVAGRRRAAPGEDGRGTCALQGFGTLARAAALALHEAGVLVTAVGDEHASVHLEQGVALARLLASDRGAPIAEHRGNARLAQRDAVLRAPVDVLVLAACEDALSERQAADLRARAVVVGANDGLAPDVEALLHRRGIPVVPDFVGGAGGSASMDALFAPDACPDPGTVLDQVTATVGGLAREVLRAASARGIPPREAALALAEAARPPLDAKPYGLRLLRHPRQGDPAAPVGQHA